MGVCAALKVTVQRGQRLLLDPGRSPVLPRGLSVSQPSPAQRCSEASQPSRHITQISAASSSSSSGRAGAAGLTPPSRGPEGPALAAQPSAPTSILERLPRWWGESNPVTTSPRLSGVLAATCYGCSAFPPTTRNPLTVGAVTGAHRLQLTRKLYLCRRGWVRRSFLGRQLSLKTVPQACHFLTKGSDLLVPSLSAGLQFHLLFDQRSALRLHHRDFVAQVMVDFHQARLLLLELRVDTHTHTW